VEAHIKPDPSAEERAAILAAVERLTAGDALPPAYRSAWRAAGVRENLDEEEEL
jgi:hypothetical protein